MVRETQDLCKGIGMEMENPVKIEAFTPLGSSVAGAIVCASLFFVAGALSLFYFFYTSKSTSAKQIIQYTNIP